MSSQRQWTDEEKRQVVEMYKAGAKYKEITATVGMPQATITWVLHKEGVRPRRVPRETVSVRVVLADLADAQRQLGQALAERDAAIVQRDDLLAEVDRLRNQLVASADC